MQSALLSVTPIVLFPIIMVVAVGGSDAEVLWAVFAMMAVNGVTVVLQSLRLGPFGSGLIVVTYPSSISIPFCIIALQEGGPATMASLVIISGLFQIAISMRLSLLRRVVTPTVSGTIIILLVITIVAVVFGNINDVPGDAPAAATPVSLGVTLAVTLGLLLRGSGPLRVWAPLIGITAGWISAVAFGIYDFGPVSQAPVAGLPLDGWPGLGLEFGSAFWSLLPAFLFVSVILVLQATSIGLTTQQVSWRETRAMDYRRVQGGASATGMGNILAGLVGGMPITTSPRGISFVQQAGCASSYVGMLTGVFLIVAAFFPKSWGLLVGIPGPVTATFLIIIISPLFLEGMKLILRDAPDYRKSLVVGVSLAIGLGFQFRLIDLPDAGVWGPMFQNGLTAGGVAVVILTFLSGFGGQGRRRLQTELSVDSLPKINEFLKDFSSRRGWNHEMTSRLQSVAEETVHILSRTAGDSSDSDGRRLLVIAGNEGRVAEVEFIGVSGDSQNLEDRIALLTEPGPGTAELELPDLESTIDREASLRLLLHYASSVTHRQYHEAEIITVRVAPTAAE